MVRKVSGGVVSTFAGSGNCGAASNGPNNTAVFGHMKGVAVASNGRPIGRCQHEALGLVASVK